MKKILFYSICAIALVACKKEVKNEQPVAGGAPATFNVFSPETKTTIDGLSVKWAEGDKIRVYGHNTSTDAYDNGTYTLSSGAGTTAGVFTKDSGEALTGIYDAYYAVYPADLEGTSVSATSIVLPRMNTGTHHFRAQNPSVGQCDPNLAIMTAKSEGDRLVFRHGVAYIKITVPVANVTKIDINFQNNCLADTPTYSADNGTLTSVDNSNKNVTSVSGTFTQGATYYFAAIPRSGYTIGNTSVTFTGGGGSISTSHFSGKVLEVGKVFDLGTPQVITDPIISAENVNLNSSATNGAITFSVTNPVAGGVMSAAIKTASPSGWLTLGDLTATTVPLTCSANDTGSPKTATVTLTYTYNSTETVTKDITVTHLSTISKVWDFSTSAWVSQITSHFTTKDTNQNDINFSYDELTVNGGGSSMKYNNSGDNYWIQTGGAGSSSSRRFEYTAPTAGTLTVYFSNTGNNAARTVKVKDSSTEHAGAVETTNTTQVSEAFTVAAGLVQIYPTNGMRFYKITFESN